MDLLNKHFLNNDNVLVFDNATTHTKRTKGALSACYMPKNILRVEKNWGVEVNQCDENGKPIYGSDGKILKKKILMTDGRLPDGTAQSFYFESGPQTGLFKGMTVILQEQGLIKESKLHAECKKFNCPTNQEVPCCLCCMLYNQPDFREVKSHLEIICKARGYKVIFLPKFHCELNFIEQCWGYARRIYQHYPPFPKEADLEANVLSALESVPLESMRRYAIYLIRFYMSSFFVAIRFAVQSARFVDGYHRGLTRKQAAWASKKYRGHHTLPESVMEALDKAELL